MLLLLETGEPAPPAMGEEAAEAGTTEVILEMDIFETIVLLLMMGVLKAAAIPTP